MRRHYYRQQYRVPKELKPPKKKRSQPLVQPAWDDTIHDLNQLRLSPEEQLRRRLSRISNNQLGVAVLSSRKVLLSGGSSRYTRSTASADAAELSSGSDDDDDENAVYAHASDPGDDLSHQQQQQHRRRQLHWDAAGPAGAAGAGAAADSDDEDDLCQWQGGLSPLQQLPQQQAQGLGALRDISNSSRMAQGHRHSQQHLKQKQPQQQDSAGSSRAAEDAACNAVHVEQDGRLLVEAQVLQLLLDKIDILEHTLRQQQLPTDGQQPGSSNQQQHHVEQQLRHQLAATEQQLARLQDEHTQYVDRTSSLLVRLQAQMQQLMRQAPGLAAVAGFGELQDLAGLQQPVNQPQPAAAWEVPARSSSPQRPAAAAATAAVPGLRSSAAGSAAGRSPSKAHLRPATAVSVTALSHRPGSTGGGSAAATPARASAAAAAAAGAGASSSSSSSSRFGSAAAQVAEAAALPSYAEMRQRRSAAGTGALWAGGASFTAAPCAAAAPAASAAAPAASISQHDAYLHSMLGASSQSDSQLPFSRAVPAPIAAPNPAAAAAAALSGAAASSVKQQQQRPGGWSNADQVAPVISAYSSAGQAAGAALAPGLAAETYGALPNMQDVGWGLAEGLPRSAVSRVFTAAGIAEAAELPPRPRALIGQLAGNVSLMDHLRAAKAAAAAQGTAADAVGMRV
uniref:Uncharacterized protein n=1 Tax=Tetradesmus obliquus TaxID=3088 RepID=A0A383W627_TETOB|eukprot:jgi/Sobl393_1/15696/SZX73107.1